MVATVILFVDDSTNKTITSTKSNILPDDVSLPPTNAAGTQTSRITVETALGEYTVIDVAYPTVYTVKPLSYSWSGSLLTSTPGGPLICSTASEYVDVFYPPYQFVTEPQHAATNAADPKGFGYGLVTAGCHYPVNSELVPTQ